MRTTMTIWQKMTIFTTMYCDAHAECSLHLSDPLQIGGKYWDVSSMRGSTLEKMHHPWARPNDWMVATGTKVEDGKSLRHISYATNQDLLRCPNRTTMLHLDRCYCLDWRRSCPSASVLCIWLCFIYKFKVHCGPPRYMVRGCFAKFFIELHSTNHRCKLVAMKHEGKFY